MERQPIFKTLDNPIRILFWNLNEFVLMSIPILLGLYSGNLLVMTLLFISAYALKGRYAKVQKRFPNGSFKHVLYWHMPPQCLRKLGKIRRLPPSHHRELLL